MNISPKKCLPEILRNDIPKLGVSRPLIEQGEMVEGKDSCSSAQIVGTNLCIWWTYVDCLHYILLEVIESDKDISCCHCMCSNGISEAEVVCFK